MRPIVGRIRNPLPYALVYALVASLQAEAAISFYEIKGLGELFKSCPELSPTEGFMAIETGMLKNIRFSGPYGPKKEPYGCHRQIQETDTDCPQDWTTALVQQLFPSPTGDMLNVNQGATEDPLSHMTPEAVGRLLNLLQQ